MPTDPFRHVALLGLVESSEHVKFSQVSLGGFEPAAIFLSGISLCNGTLFH